MKIGYVTHPREDIKTRIEWIGKNGFDFVDLFLEEDKTTPEKINVPGVRKILKRYSLDVKGHLVWYLPIGSPIESLRDASIKEAERYFMTFKNLGVKYVTIHAFWPPGLFSDNEGIDFQIDSLRKLVQNAKRYNLKLMYEPIDTPNDNVKNVGRILKAVPNLFFHLDIGHANLHGKKINEFITKYGKKLVHVHMHDNHGKGDEHLPIGKGNINFKKVILALKKVKYDGTITLEVFTEKLSQVIKSKDKLRKLWDSN